MTPLPVAAGGYACIVADPPWSFRDKGSRAAPDQRGRRIGYETMTAQSIQALPVGDIAARDALLFLWSTSAHILDGSATAVARAWGFEPKTTVAWVKRAKSGKLQVGFGHYTRAAHELVVVARRGRAKVLRRDIPSVFFAPRTRHSAKPEVFQEIVEGLAAGPYLELFARRHRVGWACWGDQLPVSEAA